MFVKPKAKLWLVLICCAILWLEACAAPAATMTPAQQPAAPRLRFIEFYSPT
jgi:hypothetical protein